MKEIELEKTFLVKRVPSELLVNVSGKDLLDIYFPKETAHPVLRVRKRGDHMTITKKRMVSQDNASEFIEDTIELSTPEYESLAQIKGKRVHKTRYITAIGAVRLDLDIFMDDLTGLVLADFEFKTILEKDDFVAPDWCLTDVTQEEFIAGGFLAGKKYKDIREHLVRFGYERPEN